MEFNPKSSWRSNIWDVSLLVIQTSSHPTSPLPGGAPARPWSCPVPAVGAGPHPSSAPASGHGGTGLVGETQPWGLLRRNEASESLLHPSFFFNNWKIFTPALYASQPNMVFHRKQNKNIFSGVEPVQLLGKALMIWTTQTKTKQKTNKNIRFPGSSI